MTPLQNSSAIPHSEVELTDAQCPASPPYNKKQELLLHTCPLQKLPKVAETTGP